MSKHSTARLLRPCSLYLIFFESMDDEYNADFNFVLLGKFFNTVYVLCFFLYFLEDAHITEVLY